MTSKVWVQLRGSVQAFRVEIVEGAIIDDLKIAIKQETAVEVELIFAEEDGDVSLCKADALISTFPPVGDHARTPYYYTIAPPGMYFSAFDKSFHLIACLVVRSQ